MIAPLLRHPEAFLAGLLMLVAGSWLLRKGGVAVLVCLSVGLANLIGQQLEAAGGLPTGALSYGALLVVAVCAALAAARHPVVARCAEFLFTVLVCLIGGPALAGWLHWPLWMFVAVMLVTVYFAPPATIATLAAALLCLAIEADAIEAAGCFLVAVAIMRGLKGRLLRGHWDPDLNRQLDNATHGPRVRRSDETAHVIFACDHPARQRYVVARLKRAGIRCEEFVGGSAAAVIPLALLKQWRHVWQGLIHVQPDAVFSATSVVTVPPRRSFKSKRKSNGLTVDEAASRLRMHDGQSLDSRTATGCGVGVAVLDTGINPVTDRLERALKKRLSFVPGEEDVVDDEYGHGSPVGEAIVAVAPAVRLYSLRVLDGNGHGSRYSVLRGLDWVARHPEKVGVVNLSLGAPCRDSDQCPLCRALAHLAEMGVASVTAAGNSGPEPQSIECPAASPGTLAVAAVDAAGQVAPFSSRGPALHGDEAKPDLCSYGVDLLLPNCDGSLTQMSGTSFSSPLVAGTAAGALSVSRLAPRELYRVLRETAVATTNETHAYGSGMANLCRAARVLQQSAPSLPAARTVRRRFSWPVTRVAVAAALLLAAIWWLGLDRLGTVARHPVAQASWVLGRVCQTGASETWLDDGTGVVQLRATAAQRLPPDGYCLVQLAAHDEATPGTYVPLRVFALRTGK